MRVIFAGLSEGISAGLEEGSIAGDRVRGSKAFEFPFLFWHLRDLWEGKTIVLFYR